MSAQVYDQTASAPNGGTVEKQSTPRNAGAKKLTLAELIEKRKRRERRENAVMMKLFIGALIVVATIVIVAVVSKYI